MVENKGLTSDKRKIRSQLPAVAAECVPLAIQLSTPRLVGPEDNGEQQ